MNRLLDDWNRADEEQAQATMISCCAAHRWARALVAMRPLPDENRLYRLADEAWAAMTTPDWLEAFGSHPRIGDRKPAHATAQSKSWSVEEQSSTSLATAEVLEALAHANVRYEETFGFTYIVCATGKSAEEMLGTLNRRLSSYREVELTEAAEQQRQIMQIRLRKWLNP